MLTKTFSSGPSSNFLASHVSSTPDVLSDACPETPDSSVREGGVEQHQTQASSGNSALLDTGKYICLWVDCGNEFDAQRQLVEHVTEAHVESSKKGCEERPCLWKVRNAVKKVAIRRLLLYLCTFFRTVLEN